MNELRDYLQFIVTLTAVLDPFIAVPIFIAMTAGASPARRKRLAYAISLTVFAVLASSALFGEALLTLTGASLPAFRVGGGLVLLLMALAMLNAEAGGVRQSRAEAQELEHGEVSGVVPLAVPLLAGPGAISTTIIAAQAGGFAHVAALIACILAVSLLLWWMLRIAPAIGRRLRTSGLNIATRLFGLLLAAIAVQGMAAGLRELLPGLN